MKAKPHYLAGLWCQFCFSVRCKRPGTISQTQHHTHPVDSWQRSSDTPGEKRYVINIFALVCYCHSLLIGRAKMSQQMELNGCYCTWPELSDRKLVWQVGRESASCDGCDSIVEKCKSTTVGSVSVLLFACVGLRVGGCSTSRADCAAWLHLFIFQSHFIWCEATAASAAYFLPFFKGGTHRCYESAQQFGLFLPTLCPPSEAHTWAAIDQWPADR